MSHSVFMLERWFTSPIEIYTNTKNFSGWIFEFRPRFFCSIAKNLVKIMKFRNPGLFCQWPIKKKLERYIQRCNPRSCWYFFMFHFEWWIFSLAKKHCGTNQFYDVTKKKSFFFKNYITKKKSKISKSDSSTEFVGNFYI